MRTLACLSIAVVGWLAGCASAPPTPTAADLIARAEAALGSAGLKTLVTTARGTGATFGQAYQATGPWPGLNYSVLTRAYDFEGGALREAFGRSRREAQGGGAVPHLGQGEQQSTGFTRDGFAWAPGPGQTGTPQPVAVAAREHDLWTSTPQGVLAAARRFQAVSGSRPMGGKTLHTLAFTAPGRFAATLVLDDAGLPLRVESTMPHPVSGDTAVITEFGDYRSVGALRFPMSLKQTAGGHPVLDLSYTEVKPGEPVAIAVPDNVRTARENATADPVAPGVWFLAGGSHNSVAIEQQGGIVLVEAPLYDGRTLAAIQRANGLVPGKTVRTVINSHHHFDHAGGLRAAAGEGAELVTSAQAKPYFERLFANPNRVAPDHLARSGRAVRIAGVAGRTTLADPQRPVEVIEMQGSLHAQGFLMVWLPRERLLIQADAYTPGPPGAPPAPTPNPNHVNLVQNIERLGLDVDRILPLHGRVVPMAELLAQVGRR